MPEYLSPGVYVEEIDTGPRPIEGVSTSTAGMVGVTERGPVGAPVLVTSYGAFERYFGGRLDGSFNGHRLFPHAVEGFFQNGGQRAYIVRALDTDNAQFARRELFNRGEGGGAESVLLRSAAEGSGTAANLPLLYVLDAAGAAQNNFVRIGDGSTAEYRQLAANPTDDSHVTLNFPLNRAHGAGAGVEQFNRVADTTTFVSGDFTLAEPAVAGNNDVLLEEISGGDAGALAAGQLIEIGGVLPSMGEHHFIESVVVVSATQTRVELGVPLAQAYPTGTGATVLDLDPGNSVDTANLDQDANAGDLIVFIDDPTAPFNNRADIVVFEGGTPNQEARRIGELSILALEAEAYDTYPAGTFVEIVQMNNDSRTIVNAITLDSVVDIAAGRTLVIGDPINPEVQVAAAVDAASRQVTLPAAFTNARASGDPVVPAHVLTVAAVATDLSITLDSVAGITDGLTLIVGDPTVPANLEVVIVNVGGIVGNVVSFTPALANGHALDAPVVPVSALTVAAVATDLSITLDSVAGIADGQTLIVGDPTVPANLEVVVVDPGGIAGNVVSFTPALANGHAMGAPVVPARAMDTVFDASTGDDTIVLDSVDDMVSGQALVVGAGGNEEPVIVQGTDATTNRVTFVGTLTNNHTIGDPVQLAVTALSNAVTAGTRSITLDSRLVLNEDDLLRIGTGADAEFAMIASIPSPTNLAPDAGLVALTYPLRNDHAAGTEVVRQGAPTVQGAQRAYLLHDAAVGAGEFVVTDGDSYLDDDIIRATLGNGDEFYHILSANATQPTARLVEVGEALGQAHAAATAFVERESLVEVQALDAGQWGNRLRVAVEDEPSGLVANTTLQVIVDQFHIRLASAAGVEPGTILHFPDPNTLDPNTGNPAFQDPITGDDIGAFVKVDGVDRNDFTLTLAAATPLPGNQQVVGRAVRSREFRITVFLLRHPDPAQPSLDNIVIDSEIFRYLSMDDRHSRYVADVIGAIDGELRQWDRRPEGTSGYIRVRDAAQINPGARPIELNLVASRPVRLGPETLTDTLPNGQSRAARHPLARGDDSIATIQDDDYIGVNAADPEDRTGLHSLRNIDVVSIVAAPGQISVGIQNALINHCEQDRYRFAVLDGPVPPGDTLTAVQTHRQNFDTLYAALYYPWLLIPEPFPTRLNEIPDLTIPPSGHVIGIYARTDNNRGVHKAPANEVVRGIRGLTRTLSKGEHDILNPSPVNINVIRDFRPDFRGIRVWGARCITSDTAYKYVPVRRLLIFIEESLDEGLQWVVFEPNAEPLWARVRRTISDFLRVVWRNGALEGTSEEQAFFVRCDRTTMTQADIDNGRLICVIGVAPVKPAEFVIIRIGLKTVEAES